MLFVTWLLCLAFCRVRYCILSLCRCQCSSLIAHRSLCSHCVAFVYFNFCRMILSLFDAHSLCAVSVELYIILPKCHLIWTICTTNGDGCSQNVPAHSWNTNSCARNENERKPSATSRASIRLINKVIPSFFFWRTHEMNGYDLASYRWAKKKREENTDSVTAEAHACRRFWHGSWGFFFIWINIFNPDFMWYLRNEAVCCI